MAVRRRHGHRRKPVPAPRKRVSATSKIKNPGYMVQLNEANLLRRDLLETLREVILFMQSYEKFKRVQQEKVHLFTSLKADLKELNMLIGSKMKAHFPKGKLHAITETEEHIEMEKEHALDDGAIRSESIGMAPQARHPKAAPLNPITSESHNELDQLEDQLRDIEAQLKGIQ
ncbi:hypothetical protein CL619_04240 [archaeon]|nr:hypothetical protein [archaeon]|tara:strand:+ start:702 stop:1220 length:519 start_codon:yes stop_codon:yes gene_type:complete